jgi:hypothetical protein
MRGRMGVAAILTMLVAGPAAARDPAAFRFHSVDSIEAMHALIRAELPPGSARERARAMFVAAGGGTLFAHPVRRDVEKYVYDIDLCGYYVWRWNVSADFDGRGRARQMYVNGEPVFKDGPSDRFDPSAKPGKKQSILRMSRARPQAAKGEASLAYILYDLDSDLGTITDQQLLGGGPSRPHLPDMGKMRVYKVDPWRSIFDADEVPVIAAYSGDCAKVDTAIAAAKPRSGG